MLTIILALLLAVLALYPIGHILYSGLKTKWTDIDSSIPHQARGAYLELFRSDKPVDDANAAFEEMYRKEYSWRLYVWPLLLFVLVLLPLSWLMSRMALAAILAGGPQNGWLLNWPNLGALNDKVLVAAVAGIAGAYLWIVADLIDGAWRLDLPASDIARAALRLIVAAPLGAAVGSIAPDNSGPFVAFAIGAFPLEQTNAILRSLVIRLLKVSLHDDPQDKQVFRLDGVDIETAEHLRQAGVTTVVQLARYDPVKLCMRTGLGFDFLLDLAGQALAWIYFGDRLEYLRRAGLRGAGEISNLYRDFKAANEDMDSTAGKVIATAAALLSDAPHASYGAESFRKACYEIAEDPYTKFLMQVWNCHAHGRHIRGDRFVLTVTELQE